MSAVVSAALAIVINVATSDTPRWIQVLRPWTWLIAGILIVAATALPVWERRMAAREAAHQPLPVSARVLAGRPRELPRDVSFFCGHDEELSQAKRLAHSRGIVAIAGKPGIGKSALAVHAAHELCDRYPDGQVFVDLRGLRDRPLPSADAMLHVIKALDQPAGQADHDDLGARYRSVLAGKRVIIVLDDAEDEAQVRPLLPPNKRSLVLITSRRALAALTEAPSPIRLKTLTEPDALRMLGALTGDERIASQVADSKVLVGQCGALPLALQIVAARLRRHPQWTIATLVERLEDERRRLDELHDADLEVRACIALSYEDLRRPGGPQASWFRRLAIIPGRDFSPETAATALGLDSVLALRALEELADAQLVELREVAQPAGAPALPRFRYHSLIRIFAEERLLQEETAAQRDDLLKRVLSGYADQLDRAATAIDARSAIGAMPALPSGRHHASQQGTQNSRQATAYPPDTAEAEATQWLGTESQNLFSALLASRDTDPGISWRLARSLLLFSEGAFPVPELQAMAQAAEEAASRLDDPGREMAACYLRGRVERLSGQLREATRSLEQSARYFIDAGDSAAASEVLLNLGKVQRERRNPGEAADALGHAFALRRLNGDYPGAAGVVVEAAVLLKECGRVQDAATVLDLAIRWLARQGRPATSRSQMAWAHENLGAILKRLGRTKEAIAHHEESLRAFRETGHLTGQAHAYCNLGDLMFDLNDVRSAQKLYQQGRKAFGQARNRRGEAQAAGRLAFALLHRRRILKCVGTLAQCLIIAQRAAYLWELFHQFRQYRPGTTKAQPTLVAHPALDQLTKTIAHARPGIEQ
jgi:tetratricopeptide (TPR) repeat protein